MYKEITSIFVTIKFVDMELSEINYTILEKLHPYYGLGLYRVNKGSINSGNQYKYQLLQTWCFPSLSISKIMKLLPVVSYRDVVELSLYYSPIPESIGKFDSYSLCYNCFLCKYDDPLFMFNREETVETGIIYSLCYAFDRLDVLINMKDRFREPWSFDGSEAERRKGFYELMCDIIRKRRGERIEVSSHEHITSYVLTGHMLMCHLPYLLQKEELLEFVFLISTADEKLYNYLFNGVEYVIIYDPEPLLFNELVASFDQDTIHKLILKYYPHSILLPSRRTYRASTVWKSDVASETASDVASDATAPIRGASEPGNPPTSFDYHLHPKLIECLPKAEQMLYYLTSGKYADYVRLRNEGISLVIDDKYALGINSFGSSTFNMDFVSSINTYMKSIEEDYSIELNDSPLLRDYGLNEFHSVEEFINFVGFAKQDPND